MALTRKAFLGCGRIMSQKAKKKKKRIQNVKEPGVYTKKKAI